MAPINSVISPAHHGTIAPHLPPQPKAPVNFIDSFDPKQSIGFQIQNALTIVAHNSKGYVGNTHRALLLEQIEKMPGSFFRRTPKDELKEALAELAPEKLNQKLSDIFHKKTPLEEADWQQVIELLKLGANPNLKVSAKNHRIGHIAIKQKRFDVLTHWAYAPGVNLNAKDELQCTPLRYAARAGILLTRILVEAGADLNVQDARGNTPLFAAAFHLDQKNSFPDIVEFLIQSGANPTLNTYMGDLPSTYADQACQKLLRNALMQSPYQRTLDLSLNHAPIQIRQEVPQKPLAIDFKKVIKKHANHFGLYEHTKTILDNVLTGNPRVCALPKSPAEKLKYYEGLQRHLEHIAAALENPDTPTETKRTALSMLNEGGKWCATRQFQESAAANRLLSPLPTGITQSELFERYIEDSLYQLRSRLFNNLLPNTNVHTYNSAMASLGVELGLAAPAVFYKGDTFTKQADIDVMRSKFYHAYSSSAIIQAIQNDVASGKIPIGIISSLLGNLVLKLPEAEQDAFYKKVLNIDGTFTWHAIPEVLLGMGVLRPLDFKKLVGLASAYLQNVMPKSKEAYLKALKSDDFSKKNGHRLSREQAERLLEAIISIPEDQDL